MRQKEEALIDPYLTYGCTHRAGGRARPAFLRTCTTGFFAHAPL